MRAKMDLTRRDFLKGCVQIASGIGISGTSAWSASKTSEPSTKPKGAQDGKKKTIVCFDGSYSIEKWHATSDLADKLADLTREPVHFTYYINTSHFSAQHNGRSNVGWAKDDADAQKRIRAAQKAIDNGHEIGSHTVRHLDGRLWDSRRWYSELHEFDKDVATMFLDAYKRPYKAIGFRAPYLSWNKDLFTALDKLKYQYDVSIAGGAERQIGHIRALGVPYFERDNGKKVLAMDYNWHVSGIACPELERMIRRELRRSPDTPLVIAMHFTDMGPDGRTYFETISSLLADEARKGSLSFSSMREYLA
jgi:peptidoglycan/xylan/chitin deacetylase (PgdA/CDA1 family)